MLALLLFAISLYVTDPAAPIFPPAPIPTPTEVILGLESLLTKTFLASILPPDIMELVSSFILETPIPTPMPPVAPAEITSPLVNTLEIFSELTVTFVFSFSFSSFEISVLFISPKTSLFIMDTPAAPWIAILFDPATPAPTVNRSELSLASISILLLFVIIELFMLAKTFSFLSLELSPPILL